MIKRETFKLHKDELPDFLKALVLCVLLLVSIILTLRCLVLGIFVVAPATSAILFSIALCRLLMGKK